MGFGLLEDGAMWSLEAFVILFCLVLFSVDLEL